jgi:alkylated DNA repair dioxygenase AlkB
MQRLCEELPLRQETLRIMGREVATPRLTSWHGDPGTQYRYSGKTFQPAPLTQELERLGERLAKAAGVRFNSVLANLYRDGSDSMGAHSDDEPELGPRRDNILIASVSLGAKRRFVLHSKDREQRLELMLGEGDLLLMGGTTQSRFKHAVPKTKKTVGARLNLTYRVIRVQPSGPSESATSSP